MRLTRLIAASVLAASSGLAPAAAQDVCATLAAQLARVQSGRDSAANLQRANAAYEQQAQQYARAYREAESAGCFGGGFLFVEPQSSVACSRAIDRLNQMQSRLERLDAQRRSYAFDPGEGERQRRAILAALDANGCGSDGYGAEARRGTLDPLFGSPATPPSWWEDDPSGYGYGYEEPRATTFRTLCVRSCDGYYFPISFATLPEQFGTDAAACQSMCPGTAVELYAHPNPGGDVEEAETPDGRRYTDLPAAFAYRRSYDAACTCHWAQPDMAAVAAGAPADAFTERLPPLPLPRPARSEDSETLANRAGRLRPGPVEAGDALATTADARQRIVRQIGPSYYYAQ